MNLFLKYLVVVSRHYKMSHPQNIRLKTNIDYKLIIIDGGKTSYNRKNWFGLHNNFRWVAIMNKQIESRGGED